MNKTILTISIITALGIGGYFGYKYYKKRESDKKLIGGETINPITSK